VEQSAPTCHVRTFYACFPKSPQGFSLQAFIPITSTATFVIFRHLIDLFTYLLLEKEMEKWCHLWRDRKTSIEGAEVTRFRNVFHVRAAATGKGANN